MLMFADFLLFYSHIENNGSKVNKVLGYDQVEKQAHTLTASVHLLYIGNYPMVYLIYPSFFTISLKAP